VWLFHCHIEWHVMSGLVATFVEAPLEIQQVIVVPQNHFDVCKAGNVSTVGNAAGNTANLLNLAGQNAPPGALPTGFTTKGVVAFVFTCLCGLLGTAVVAWYGFADVSLDQSAAQAPQEPGVLKTASPASAPAAHNDAMTVTEAGVGRAS
jgi:iron transport multicopper oxidase